MVNPNSKPAVGLKAFALALADAIDEKSSEGELDIGALKMELAQELRVMPFPKNAAILAALPPSRRTPAVLSALRTRLTRTASGVSPIALMPKPFPCPGQCTYCPSAMREEISPDGTRRPVLFAPKSYTGFEPATMRAIQNDYDARKQIEVRLSQFEALGQPTDKCELIIMGGTFLSASEPYRSQFIQSCYDAMNGVKEASETLAAAQTRNESSPHRVIGLTIETRPDWCQKSHIDTILSWGATRVELGVQSLDDEVLAKVKRGHPVAETIRATSDLKNAAYKVGYHYMPGLYSTHAQDVSSLRRLFSVSSFCPDMLKLYPCLVMAGTELYDEWKAGRFAPIDAADAVSRIADATSFFPPWVRVMRMQRDIPANKISAGVKNGNLHQMVTEELANRGEKCRCIRCREVFYPFRRDAGAKRKPLRLSLVEREYPASGGIEHFISYEDEDQDVLAGFIRLRLPPTSHRPEIDPNLPAVARTSHLPIAALIRELHVYGQEVPLEEKTSASPLKVQHTGLGKSLLARAEAIAREAGRDKIVILSGVGVRPYYAKLGYRREGPYMVRRL